MANSTTASWGFQPYTIAETNGGPKGLIFAETDDYIYSFGIQDVNFLISRMSSATGLVLWTYSAPHNLHIGFQSLELLVLQDDSSVLVAATGDILIRIFVQLQISPAGIMTSSMQYSETSTTD